MHASLSITRWLLILSMLFASSILSAAESPDFLTEVMPVLAKGGCNMGACHGNLNGKGGFKLSLRGESPEKDYLRLTRENGARRVDWLQPSASLILLKATSQVSHQGGRRFGIDSSEYELLRAWITSGSPGPSEASPKLLRLEVQPPESVLFDPVDRVQLKAEAVFASGERRDVTAAVVYDPATMSVSVTPDGEVVREAFGETTVVVRFLNQHAAVRVAFLPARSDFVWNNPPVHNEIDQLVDRRLQPLRTNPSPLADDATFVRRAYLDTIGLPPTSAEAQAFVEDVRPDKRMRLIDALLTRAEFAEHWALKWADLLKNEEKVLDNQGVKVFHGWIRDSIAAGKPMDQFVRELISSRGSTYKEPAANFWRANRDPLTRGETTARLFLGVRLQCAKCHNHPFERWTQDDYYSWAALFARIDYKLIDNKRNDKLDKHEFIGEQIVEIKSEGETKNARTGKDAPPKFLGADTPAMPPKADRLPPLATWLTDAANDQFTQSQANFVWYHLMGQGLVDPIDDFRDTNPAANPELLHALAKRFVDSGFDLRSLVREIMNSRTYQLSAEPLPGNEQHAPFTQAIVRRLTAEQLLDAQCRVLDTPAAFAGYDRGIRAGQLPGVTRVRRRDIDDQSSGDRFLRLFGKPERLLACECERSNETTLSQTFALISGDSLHQRLTNDHNRLAQMARSNAEAPTLINELFWTALSRPPTTEEATAASEYFAVSENRQAALQDLCWALMNSKEFLFRH